MSGAAAANSWKTWVLSGTALAATSGVAAVLFLVIPSRLVPQGTLSAAAPQDEGQPGVRLAIRAGGVAIERTLPGPAFALEEGQTLDPRLPPGPFDGTLSVTFDPAPTAQGTVGAVVENLTVALERHGETVLPAQRAAGNAPAALMSGPLFFPPRPVTYVYRITYGGAGPARFRAVWRPKDAAADLPIPAWSWPLVQDTADQGLVLFQELNCARCHRSGDAALEARLAVSTPPYLGHAGARLRPAWVRRWIADPGAVQPAAPMPALFRDGAADAAIIEDLAHLVISWGGPIPAAGEPDDDLAATGQLVFGRTGCVACHGPVEGAAPDPELAELAGKTTLPALAAFLADPLAVHPSGRMPAMKLSELEAQALASYLLRVSAQQSGTPEDQPLVPDPARVQRGLAAFTARGCANCHESGHGAAAIVSTLQAPGLESLAARGGGTLRGCLAESVAPGVPDYHLQQAQRGALAAFIETVGQWRSHDVPLLELACATDRLSCFACHGYGGHGGPGPDRERWFTTAQDADVGDEGRLPPDLAGAGGRLTPQWIDAVLAHGAAARPYMATRMPQFGPGAAALPALLGAAAGTGPPRDAPPGVPDPEIGRRLVGAGGFNCIQCHAIAGRAATSTPGPDLVQMTGRVRFEHFNRWLLNPGLLRPGTRMPTFFSEGRSGLPELGGDGPAQAAAIWSYLGQGESLPLPDGLSDPGDFEINTSDRPVILRTFMEAAGPRAIAVGLPQRINYAFDAEACALRLIWTGRFLNAAGSWGARGGSNTDPDQPPAWTSAQPVLEGTPRFRGYRLDAARRPVFLYDLDVGGAVVHVAEAAEPSGASSLTRTFDLQGPAGTVLNVHAPGGPQRLEIDGNGAARLTMEVTW